MIKNPPIFQETWVQFLGREGPLEKEMATHSSILAGEFHGQWSLAGYTVHGVAKNWDFTSNSTSKKVKIKQKKQKYKHTKRGCSNSFEMHLKWCFLGNNFWSNFNSEELFLMLHHSDKSPQRILEKSQLLMNPWGLICSWVPGRVCLLGLIWSLW